MSKNKDKKLKNKIDKIFQKNGMLICKNPDDFFSELKNNIKVNKNLEFIILKTNTLTYLYNSLDCSDDDWSIQVLKIIHLLKDENDLNKEMEMYFYLLADVFKKNRCLAIEKIENQLKNPSDTKYDLEIRKKEILDELKTLNIVKKLSINEYEKLLNDEKNELKDLYEQKKLKEKQIEEAKDEFNQYDNIYQEHKQSAKDLEEILINKNTKEGEYLIMGENLTGLEINTKFDVKIKVKEKLGEGGQGDVYKVDYCGEEKALKWYKKNAIGETTRKLLEQNINNGAPSPQFLWPKDITEYKNDTFGYIMDLRPEGYYEVSLFMNMKVRFTSFKIATKACLNIISAFRKLHSKGYCYQDMNDGNFFINPNNGDVLICDNDNVVPSDGSQETKILGKPGYMAPEIVLGKNTPDNYSDRYSLSVILFILTCYTRPLEGKKLTSHVCVTPKLLEEIYGSNPVFIMDKENKSNEPDPLVHKNINVIWPFLPEYIKDIFLKAFSYDVLNNRLSRIEVKDWLQVYMRFNGDIYQCECGEENFSNGKEILECDSCKKTPNYTTKLKLKRYELSGVLNTVIYRSQLGITNIDDELKEVAIVTSKKDDKNKYGLRNLETNEWTATTPSGNIKKVLPGEVVPLNPGISIITGDKVSKIEIIEK